MLNLGGRATPVRVRNISSHGALIDGSNIPPAGTEVVLLRGDLSAKGRIAWLEREQAGITFEQSLAVDAWTGRPASRGQQRVDEIVTALKRSERIPDRAEVPERPQSLATLAAEIDSICERLASIPDMPGTLCEELLRLDAVAHSLRRLAKKPWK